MSIAVGDFVPSGGFAALGRFSRLLIAGVEREIAATVARTDMA